MTDKELLELASWHGLVRTGNGWTEPHRWGASEIKAFAIALVERETEPAWMDAKRLAMELECLLMSCDLPAASKWWDSAHEALELHRQLVKERQEQS